MAPSAFPQVDPSGLVNACKQYGADSLSTCISNSAAKLAELREEQVHDKAHLAYEAF